MPIGETESTITSKSNEFSNESIMSPTTPGNGIAPKLTWIQQNLKGAA